MSFSGREPQAYTSGASAAFSSCSSWRAKTASTRPCGDFCHSWARPTFALKGPASYEARTGGSAARGRDCGRAASTAGASCFQSTASWRDGSPNSSWTAACPGPTISANSACRRGNQYASRSKGGHRPSGRASFREATPGTSSKSCRAINSRVSRCTSPGPRAGRAA